MSEPVRARVGGREVQSVRHDVRGSAKRARVVVRVNASARVCVCVCVRERERERVEGGRGMKARACESRCEGQEYMSARM